MCEDCEARIGVLLGELGGLKISAEPPIRYRSLQGSSAAVTTWSPSRSTSFARFTIRWNA